MLGVEVEAGQRLVQMRNPWGKGVWKSTDPLLERVNAQLLTGSKDDGGIFYMPFEELKLNFEELSICHYHDKYVYSQKRHKYTENDIFPFQIVVEQAGEYYVSISKPDKRFIWAGSADSFMSVVLVKVGKDKSAAYVGGIGGIHRDPFFCAELATGTYVAFVRCSHQVNVNFRGDFAEAQMEFAVNTFGPAKCVIEPIGETDRELCLTLFKDSFLGRNQQATWTAFGAPGSEFEHVKYCFVHGTDGYGYCAIKNSDKLVDVRAEVEIDGNNVNFSNLV